MLLKRKKKENESIAKYKKNVTIVKKEGRRKPKNETLLQK